MDTFIIATRNVIWDTKVEAYNSQNLQANTDIDSFATDWVVLPKK